MPTPKQVRMHYANLMKKWYQLSVALTMAHNAGVIDYEGYSGVSPCQANEETKARIKKTTEKQLAKAVHDETVTELKINWI